MAFVTRDGYMIDWVEAFLATSTAGPSSTPLEHPSTFFQGGFSDCSPASQTHPFTQGKTSPDLLTALSSSLTSQGSIPTSPWYCLIRFGILAEISGLQNTSITTPPPFGPQFGSVAPSSSDSGVSGYDPLRDQLASHHGQVTPLAVPPLRREHRDVRPPPCGTEGCLEPPQPRHGRGRRGGQ
ncbi:hypothetical protein PIB30_057626 [Stylosanthes scabra]|uniref:Uncharacterized protein n=1 Tax=Stylosanthes scabra TaxID=79078 RepID=A0ABU6TL17_9FABA|nr:hypothetical protein [Stylosanthes scabra]